MKINITKEMLEKAGELGLRVGKRIIIEGTKAVILKGTVATMEAKFNGEKVTLEKVLGEDKKIIERGTKKSIFKRKKKVVVDSDELNETLTDLAEDAYVAGKMAEHVENMTSTDKMKGSESEGA